MYFNPLKLSANLILYQEKEESFIGIQESMVRKIWIGRILNIYIFPLLISQNGGVSLLVLISILISNKVKALTIKLNIIRY